MSYERLPMRIGASSVELHRASRVLGKRQLESHVRINSTDLCVDEAIAIAEGYTAATGNAMTAVARVGQLQTQLELLNPACSARLNLLADDHALSMVEALADLRQDLRRR